MISRSKCRRGRPLPYGRGRSGSKMFHSSFVRSLGYLWPRRSYRATVLRCRKPSMPLPATLYEPPSSKSITALLGPAFPTDLLSNLDTILRSLRSRPTSSSASPQILAMLVDVLLTLDQPRRGSPASNRRPCCRDEGSLSRRLHQMKAIISFCTRMSNAVVIVPSSLYPLTCRFRLVRR